MSRELSPYQTAPILIFVLLPNPGVIDQWLPVIERLGPETKIVLLSPHPANLYQLRSDDQMVKILSRRVGRVVFRVQGVGWFHADDIRKAKIINRACLKGSRLFSRANGFGSKCIFDLVRFLIGFVGKLRFWRHVTEIGDEIRPGDKVMGDFGVFQEACMDDVADTLSGCDIYSLVHGIIPKQSGKPLNSLDQRFTKCGSVNLYAFSAEAARDFQTRYNMANLNTRVVGIPRHDFSWISKIQNMVKLQKFDKCIYVISRPSNNTYHPAERKTLALKDIKEVADQLGLAVVIRAHPKEFEESVFFDVFGLQEYGHDWVITKEHSYCAGRNALFAVVFHSGVCADMVRLGVPVIERLNLEGLPAHYTAALGCVFDTCEPMSSYLAAGLVLRARSRVEFLDQVERVLSDRDGVVAELQEAYARYFAEPNLQQVVDDILC